MVEFIKLLSTAALVSPIVPGLPTASLLAAHGSQGETMEQTAQNTRVTISCFEEVIRGLLAYQMVFAGSKDWAEVPERMFTPAFLALVIFSLAVGVWHAKEVYRITNSKSTK